VKIFRDIGAFRPSNKIPEDPTDHPPSQRKTCYRSSYAKENSAPAPTQYFAHAVCFA
jgi:hypothetical protein